MRIVYIWLGGGGSAAVRYVTDARAPRLARCAWRGWARRPCRRRGPCRGPSPRGPRARQPRASSARVAAGFSAGGLALALGLGLGLGLALVGVGLAFLRAPLAFLAAGVFAWSFQRRRPSSQPPSSPRGVFSPYQRRRREKPAVIGEIGGDRRVARRGEREARDSGGATGSCGRLRASGAFDTSEAAAAFEEGPPRNDAPRQPAGRRGGDRAA